MRCQYLLCFLVATNRRFSLSIVEVERVIIVEVSLEKGEEVTAFV